MTDAITRDPPISLRLGRDREKRFDAFRAREKLKQSEALHRLIDHGLDAEGFPDPKAIGSREVRAQLGATKPAPGSRLKKDPAVKKRWGV